MVFPVLLAVRAHNRIFWSISFVVFTGVTLYFIIEAVLAYFAYPTQTSVGFSDQWPQAFLAVTICNYSPVRYNQFIGSYLNYIKALNLTQTTDTSTFSATSKRYIFLTIFSINSIGMNL